MTDEKGDKNTYFNKTWLLYVSNSRIYVKVAVAPLSDVEFTAQFELFLR